MANRDSFSHYGQDANSNSGSFPLPNTGVPTPTVNNSPALKLPITNVAKIMRQILPPKTKISDDTKEIVQECASKYIPYITKKAKERCKSEYRKIMKVEDLFWAMESLGFADYIAPLKLYLRRYFLEDKRNRGELVTPNTLIQDTNKNWFDPGSGSGSGFGPESVPVQSIVEIPQPTLPTVEIPQPSLPVSPAPIGPDFSIDPSPMDMFDLEEFRDGFDNLHDFNFDDLFNGGDDGKTN